MQDSVLLKGKMKYGCVHGVTEYGEMEVWLPLFLTLALDGGEWLA